MEGFHTASGTEDAEFLPETSTEVPGAEHAVLPPTTEDPPPRQPQGRRPAILGGQPTVTSTPIRLRSTKHQPPVRHPIALTGNALPDCRHNPCVAKAENLEKAQQAEIVGQSEGTCEPLLAAAPTFNRNQAIITTPHAITSPSIVEQGANPTTKDEPDVVHWEQFFISFGAAAASWQALPNRWSAALRIHCDDSALEILESPLPVSPPYLFGRTPHASARPVFGLRPSIFRQETQETLRACLGSARALQQLRVPNA
ncbi:hypothetical protein Efla_001330 [Eimeria flavescens]